MDNQEFVVNSETLSDGSTAWNIVVYDGNSRVTIAVKTARDARWLADRLNDLVSWVSVANR